MKVLCGQINFKVGDLEGNLLKVKETLAQEREWDIAVFPELGIMGYPPLDLLFKKGFLEKENELIRKLASDYPEKPIIIGSAERINAYPKNRHDPTALNDFPYRMYNCAKLLFGGKIIDYQAKFELPVYDIFNEPRYFIPGKDVRAYFLEKDGDKYSSIRVFRVKRGSFNLEEIKGTLQGEKEAILKQLGPGDFLGISVCEDIWVEGSVPYIQAKAGVNNLINVSASPYFMTKKEVRRKMLSELSSSPGRNVFYINLPGGQDSLVFEGESYHFKEGVLQKSCVPFREDVQVLGEHLNSNEDDLPSIEYVRRALVTGVRDYFRKNGFQNAFIGLSGGIDSALTAVIAVDALGKENVTGVLMPGPYSSDHSVTDAMRLAENLGIEHHTIYINDAVKIYTRSLKPALPFKKTSLTEQNIQARIRGNLLMAFANEKRGIVLATGNKSEMAVGYSTLYGDLAGGIAVLSDIYKTTVYDLSNWINEMAGKEIIPVNIIDKPPSAELAPDQFDDDDLPPYDILDPILKMLIEQHCSAMEVIEKGFDEKVVHGIIRRVMNSEFKRQQAPFGIKITPKAFGFGRIMPITQGYKD